MGICGGNLLHLMTMVAEQYQCGGTVVFREDPSLDAGQGNNLSSRNEWADDAVNGIGMSATTRLRAQQLGNGIGTQRPAVTQCRPDQPGQFRFTRGGHLAVAR